jgi:hypothetical protein
MTCMRKKFKQTLGIYALVFPILFTPGCNTCIPCKSKPVPDNSSWMERDLHLLGDRKLDQLILPASHDAGMYSETFLGWGRTQCLSIFEQLSYGVRWFDLRPRWNGEKFVIHHGPIDGPDFSEILEDIKRFMSLNHHELILLKLSDFGPMSLKIFGSLSDQINDALGPWTFKSIPAGKRLSDLVLLDFVASGPAILVLIDNNLAADNKIPGIWSYGDCSSKSNPAADLFVYDVYSNTPSLDRMYKDQLEKFDRFTGKDPGGVTNCDLFLLSWTLTTSFRIWKVSQPALGSLQSVLRNHPLRNSHGRTINLVYVDFVEMASVTEIAIAANQRLTF